MKKVAKETKPLPKWGTSRSLPGCYLSPTVDLVFKKLFGTDANKDLTISLLNSILKLPHEKQIVDVVFNDPSNHLELIRQKYSIVDIRCTDSLGNKFIIEMQNDDYHNFPQRAQYYGACGLSSQLAIAEEYGILLPVIFVGIVNFSLFERHERYLTNHATIDLEDNSCDLSLMTYHFIELPKFKKTEDQLETLVDKWIYFIKKAGEINKIPEELKASKTFKHAFQVLTQSAWTEKEMALYRAQIDARRVEQGVLETAEIKGRDEALFSTARNLLAQGIDVNIIATATGLSPDAIKNLKTRKA